MRDGWVDTVLGELAEITTGSRAKGGAITSGIPSIGGEQIAEDRSIKFNKMKFIPKDHFESMRTGKLKFGDSLLVKDGATTGKVGYWGYDIPAAVNEHVFILRAKPDCAEPYFINLLISHRPFREEIESRTRGIIGGITRDIENIELVVPSLPEQKRIVDLISSVDSYIEALQKQLESAKRSRNAVLHELLTTGSDDWIETTLGEICTDGLFADGDWVESKDQDPEGDYRLLQLADIGDGTFLNKSDRWMNREQFNRLGCTKLEVNDVLIARMPDPIGRACLFPEGLPTCATVVDVAIVRTGNETLQKFLTLLINSSDFRTEAFSLLTGTTRQRISRGNLAKIAFAIPPTAKQLEIVNLISSFDAEIAKSARVIDEAKQLRSGLLSDLLSGEHGIPASYDKVMGAA